MEVGVKGLLWIHVITGNLALLSGLLVMFLKKGGLRHRTLGKAYLVFIVIMGFSALLISLLKANHFLFHIGVFVMYQALSGYNSLRSPSRAMFITLSIIAGINGLMMLASFNVVLMVFGGISISLVFGDVSVLAKWGSIQKTPYANRLRRHIGMMIGSFIGTVTAFLVVNIQIPGYGLLLWLGPTALLVPLMIWWQAKFPKRLTIIFLGLFFLSNSLSGQVYLDGEKTRHRFAQLNLGASFNHHFSQAPIEAFDQFYDRKALNEMRLVIGGTHFWGHADFFIAIPVVNWGTEYLISRVETGMRLYPWQIQEGKVRPFIGASWRPDGIRFGEGASFFRHQTPVTAGLTYLKNGILVTAGMGMTAQQTTEYYFSRDQKRGATFPRYYGFFSMKFMLEGTIGAEKEWLNGKTKWITDTLAKLGRLDGITMAVGISSGMFQGSGAYNAALAPYLGKHHLTNVFADLGLGYYFFKPDIQINLAYRQNSSEISGHGAKQTFSRQALTLEAYKFVFDYHGFVPFVGPALSYEWLGFQENFNQESFFSNSGLFPGITFGWDIRPNDLQNWYLRTNLRWFPTLYVQGEGARKHRVPLLEFNFIQLVIFPGRFLGY
jgi:uncharacterized membrane protein